MINMLAHNATVTPKPEDQLTKGIDRRQKKDDLEGLDFVAVYNCLWL